MAIVFKNGKWFDTELNKVVNSPFTDSSRSGSASAAALAKNTDLADAYSQMGNMPFNALNNSYMPMQKGGFDSSRFTDYGNRFSRDNNLNKYMEGDFFKNLYNNTYNADKTGLGKYLNKENLGMLATGSEIFGNVAGGIGAMRNASTARRQLENNTKLDSANFYARSTDYNTQADLINQKLVADGREPTYKMLPTTYT